MENKPLQETLQEPYMSLFQFLSNRDLKYPQKRDYIGFAVSGSFTSNRNSSVFSNDTVIYVVIQKVL